MITILRAGADTKVFISRLAHAIRFKSNPLFLCIGSDRLPGDIFGPMVGHLLARSKLDIQGNFSIPVCQHDIEDIIKRTSRTRFTVVISSTLGPKNDIGLIKMDQCPTYPYEALGQRRLYIGNLSLQYISAQDTGLDDLNRTMLSNTAIGPIVLAAETLASSILKAFAQPVKVEEHIISHQS